MTEPAEESSRWTDGGRAAFVDAAEAAWSAYRRYIDLVANSASDADRDDIMKAEMQTALAFVDASTAEFSFSGTIGPRWAPRVAPVSEQEPTALNGEPMVTILERRDYFLRDADAVRATARWDAVVPERPEEEPPARSDTELLGHVLSRVVMEGADDVAALPGIERGLGLVVIFAHDRTLQPADELRDQFTEGTAFNVHGLLLESSTFD